MLPFPRLPWYGASYMPSCHACGAELPKNARIGRRETCATCGADLHVCRNCRFQVPGMHNDCAEPQAERVVEKDRANFCEYFAPGERVAGATSVSSARARLDSLFRKRDP